MAGTGKSTIARTIADIFASQDQLGASFFFEKGEGERGSASRFFSTVASDLASREPGMLPGIRSALEDDPGIADRAMKDQFEKLILQPLSSIQQSRSPSISPSVFSIVVIDALDECEREEDIRAILELLARTRATRPIALRVLVTSRPELPIRLGFEQMTNGTLPIYNRNPWRVGMGSLLFSRREIDGIGYVREGISTVGNVVRDFSIHF